MGSGIKSEKNPKLGGVELSGKNLLIWGRWIKFQFSGSVFNVENAYNYIREAAKNILLDWTRGDTPERQLGFVVT